MPWTSFVTTTKDAVVGHATDALGNAPDPFVWDEGNTVNVYLLDSADTLSSVTEDEVIGGYNIGVLGDEIIQWQNATLEADGTYTLSRLLRGRKGSDYATDDHAVGDIFVVLDLDVLQFVQMTPEDKDQRVQFRATSVGMPVSSFSTTEKDIRLRNLRPLSPQHVSGTRDESGNLTIGWIRRTQVDGEWRDNRDVGLGEISELYELDVYNNSALVRSVTGLYSSSYEYTAAQQVADFGSVQSSVKVKVYQISVSFYGSVGRGFGAVATV